MKVFTTINPNDNFEAQSKAVSSWSNKYQVYSVNTKEEIEKINSLYPNVTFVETKDTFNYKTKKLIKLNSILSAIDITCKSETVAIVNSDILLNQNLQININSGILANFKDIKSELYINNNHTIEKIDDNYLLNISLLKYIDMCFHEISPHLFNFIKNNFRNRMYCSYEKQEEREIREKDKSSKINYDNCELNKLDISNIKLGKHSYTLKFSAVN